TPHVLRMFNGAMARLAPGKPEIIDHLRVGRRLKDGDLLIDLADPTISERRRMSFVGMVSVAVAIDAKGNIAGDPDVAAMGLPTRTRGGADMIDFIGDVVDEALDSLPRQRRRNPDLVERVVERS